MLLRPFGLDLKLHVHFTRRERHLPLFIDDEAKGGTKFLHLLLKSEMDL